MIATGLAPPLAALAALAIGWRFAALLQGSPLAPRLHAMRTVVKPRDRRWWRHAERAAMRSATRVRPELLRAFDARAQAAGWTSPAAGSLLLGAGVVLPIVLPLLAASVRLVSAGQDAVATGIIVACAAIAGRFGPGLLAANMTERRVQAIAAGLPDAIDLLVICAESGLSLDVALARTGRELTAAQPAIAAELAMTATELGFLPRRADAFANLARRVPLQQLGALADMLTQTERFGTPLAQALRTLAAEYRTGRLLRAEEKAARLPALMTIPMIAFILPPLFIVLIGPAIIAAMGS